MKKKLKQLLALVLTLAVVMGFALPAAAADPGPRVTIEKVSNDAATAEPEMQPLRWRALRPSTRAMPRAASRTMLRRTSTARV